jgi:hypothetical protein
MPSACFVWSVPVILIFQTLVFWKEKLLLFQLKCLLGFDSILYGIAFSLNFFRFHSLRLSHEQGPVLLLEQWDSMSPCYLHC